MEFALICIDKPDHQDLRARTREAHLAYVRETGVVRIAGPFLSDAGAMIGSLVILSVPDRAAAEDWSVNDPYAKAGLFSDVTVHAWKQTV
ncbi:YciI family protein [Halovulum dunhuangense]|uniref:YciI family protein n=1 Tax=Halovulum dunhuangense TaxID=1505036 RepID=A0A849KZL3_9RHOB|nr:YciI family protein [Halovulum dunhuangense]NNU79264.1 YciI family protein [Halovulum dunhuangense]